MHANRVARGQAKKSRRIRLRVTRHSDPCPANQDANGNADPDQNPYRYEDANQNADSINALLWRRTFSKQAAGVASGTSVIPAASTRRPRHIRPSARSKVSI